MKKKVFGRKLSRSRPAREALFASLARAMILNGKITTTRAKGKSVQSNLERFITLAKKGSLSSKRSILARLDNARDVFDILLSRIVPAFSKRTSGYTRLVRLPSRRGDNAEMVRVEWTEKVEVIEKSLPLEKKKVKEGKVKTQKTAVTKTKKVKSKKRNENLSTKTKRG